MKYLNDISYKDCAGKVCKSTSSGNFKVLKYKDWANVEIQFLNTGYETVTRFDHIRNGLIKDPHVPSVYGVGVLGTKHPTTINGVQTKEYVLWCSMLKRCYSEGYKKKHQTYKDCEVSENFKSYEYFYEWCNEQFGFGVDGFELDKREHLGYFKTELEAFNAYKQAKESFIKEQAEKWKSQIDPRAYNALMNYTVENTD